MDNDMLFALRTYYQDFYQDEKDIIEMLKTNLLEKNVPSNEVNNVLKNFYNEFGINIDLEIFEQINALPTEQELFNELNPLIQNFINTIINTNQNVDDSDEDSDDEILNVANNYDSDEELLENNSDNELFENLNNDTNSEINNNQPHINYYPSIISDNEGYYPSIISANEGYYQDISSDFVSFQPYTGIHYYQPFGSPYSNQYNLFGNNNVQINNITNLLNLLTTVIPIVQHEDTNVVCTLDDEDKNKLKKYKLDEDMKTQCNICLDNMLKDQEVMDLPCDHTYHYECINEYLEKYNYKCPCCRSEVGKPKYNI